MVNITKIWQSIGKLYAEINQNKFDRLQQTTMQWQYFKYKILVSMCTYLILFLCCVFVHFLSEHYQENFRFCLFVWCTHENIQKLLFQNCFCLAPIPPNNIYANSQTGKKVPWRGLFQKIRLVSYSPKAISNTISTTPASNPHPPTPPPQADPTMCLS
jgi:membrane-associated HD superfamily phosphohydrolase